MKRPTNKIRIAFVIDQLGTGGTERQLKLITECLDRDRFVPVLFLLRGELDHPMKPANIPCHLLGIDSIGSLKGLKRMLHFSRLLRRYGFDIIQTFFQDAAFCGTLAGRLAGIKRIYVSVRDMLFWTDDSSVWPLRFAIYLSHGVSVNSEAVKKKVVPISGKKPIFTIHNGIATGKRFERNETAKDDFKEELTLKDLPVIVLVANCNRRVKRVDLLIECIPQVINQTQAYFIIVGDGWMRPALEKRVEQLEITRWVRFTGIRNDIDYILSASDIALNTSDSEGFSNSVMEAMRAGLPVIATDVGGNKELIKDKETGILFKPGSVEDLKDKLLFLLMNKKLAEEIGKAAKLIIKTKFDINIIMRHYINLYESMISDR